MNNSESGEIRSIDSRDSNSNDSDVVLKLGEKHRKHISQHILHEISTAPKPSSFSRTRVIAQEEVITTSNNHFLELQQPIYKDKKQKSPKFDQKTKSPK